MFEKGITRATKQVLLRLTANKFIADKFYLAGGTALALQLGHRESVDLDFFAARFPKMEILLQELREFDLKIISQDKKTLDVLTDGVKVSFLGYEYPMLDVMEDYKGVKLASILDISVMKLSAIMSRGSKKDFIDLFFLLDGYPLDYLVEMFGKKYAGIKYDLIHLKKSLIYFNQAEEEPMPVMVEKVGWERVKERLEREVKKLGGGV